MSSDERAFWVQRRPKADAEASLRPDAISEKMEGPPLSRHYPSEEYLERLIWSRRFHLARKTFDGTRSFHIFPTLLSLCRRHGAKSLLDYGAGKGLHYTSSFTVEGKQYGSLMAALDLHTVYCYDPAWQPFAVPPPEGERYDGVLCNDVLQFIPLQDLSWVLGELLKSAAKFLCIQTACKPGKKPWGDAASREQGRPEGLWVTLLEAALAARSDRDAPDVVLRLRDASVIQPLGKAKCHIWRLLPDTGRMSFVGLDNLSDAEARNV